jgi:hypothetical protein
MFSFQLVVAFLAFTVVHSSPARHGKNVNGLGVPISNPDVNDIIPGKYIVVYNANATDDAVQLHQASVMKAFRKRGMDFSSKMRTFSMTGWRGMTLEAEDNGIVIDIANAAEVFLSPISLGITYHCRSIMLRQTPKSKRMHCSRRQMRQRDWDGYHTLQPGVQIMYSIAPQAQE